MIEVWIVFISGLFLGSMLTYVVMKDESERRKREANFYRNGGKVYIFEKENN